MSNLTEFSKVINEDQQEYRAIFNYLSKVDLEQKTKYDFLKTVIAAAESLIDKKAEIDGCLNINYFIMVVGEKLSTDINFQCVVECYLNLYGSTAWDLFLDEYFANDIHVDIENYEEKKLDFNTCVNLSVKYIKSSIIEKLCNKCEVEVNF